MRCFVSVAILLLLLLSFLLSVADATASAYSSASFRVFPCPSVSILMPLLVLPSVFFRVRPWQMLLLLSLLPSVVSSYFRVIS